MKQRSSKIKLGNVNRGRVQEKTNQKQKESVNKRSKSAIKIDRKSPRKASTAKKTSMGKPSGEYRVTRSRAATPVKKAASKSASPMKSQKVKKSPRVDRLQKKKNLNRGLTKKNAPSKKTTRRDSRGRRSKTRKEIAVVVKSPKVKETPSKVTSGTPAKASIKASGRTPSKTPRRTPLIKTDRITRSSQSVTKKDLDSASKLMATGKKRIQKSAMKRKGRGPARNDFQIIIETPKGRATPSRKSAQKVSPSRKQTPSKAMTPSKAKQRMKMLIASDEEDDFIKKVKQAATPKSKDKKSKDKKKLIKKEASPVVKSTTPGKVSQSKVIKPLPRAQPKLSTRVGRKGVTDKALENAMQALDKVRLTPKKKETPKQRTKLAKSLDKKQKKLASASVSVSPTKVRERSRDKEETSRDSQKSEKKKYFLNSASRKKAPSTHSLSSRTPTKKFQKEKTPSSSEEEEEVIKSSKKTPFKKFTPTKTKVITKREIKMEVSEESEEEKDISSSEERAKRPSGIKASIVQRPIKHTVSYKVDTKGISDEITKILAKIEERKKKGIGVKATPKTVRRGLPKRPGMMKKLSAKDYNFKLQKNPNIKPQHIVKIFDLESKQRLTCSDVLLAILEIASNADYYMIAFSNNSKFFWEDVINYEDVKRIFGGFKGETLRKYWRFMCNIADVNKIADLVKRNKKLLDDKNVKLLPIVHALKGYFSGEETSFEQALKNQTTVSRSKEVVREEKINPITGEVISVKTTRETRAMKKKFATGATEDQRLWTGQNYVGQLDVLETATASPKNEGYPGYMNILNNEEKKKFEYLSDVNHKEKVKILKHTEDDKFLYKFIDHLLDDLHKAWPQYPKEYLLKILANCSFNPESVLVYLLDPLNKTNLIFNDVDDNVILSMKDKDQYKLLCKQKGKDRVEQRTDYLTEDSSSAYNNY